MSPTTFGGQVDVVGARLLRFDPVTSLYVCTVAVETFTMAYDTVWDDTNRKFMTGFWIAGIYRSP